MVNAQSLALGTNMLRNFCPVPQAIHLDPLKVAGTRTVATGRFRQKSTVGGRLREKSTVGGRLSEKKGRRRRRRGKEEKKKREEERIPSARASSSPTRRPRSHAVAACGSPAPARRHLPRVAGAFSPARGERSRR
ncbi:hypothetical protein BHM03_00056747, partial [Ensete ventricosum]